jgi:hypothetical protein
MYYEEKIIDGILHYRTSPKAEFKPYTLESLTYKISNYKDEIKKYKESLKEIESPISFMRNRLQEGEELNGIMAIELSKDHNYLKGIARKVLSDENVL